MHNCLIMGSGRSGTSMLSGCLYHAGYHMGDDLYPPHHSNPKGFFENDFINGINEKILEKTRQLNSSLTFPYDPLKYGQRWLEILPEGTRLYVDEEIRGLIRSAVSHHGFCYKDPRFSYTLPVWEKQLGECRFLVVFREPEITAESIQKECSQRPYLRDVKMNTQRALQIWQSTYTNIFNRIDDEKKWMFVHYDQLFLEDSLGKIERFLDTPIDRNFPDPQLKRTRAQPVKDEEIQWIYRRLCKMAAFPYGEKGLSVETAKKISPTESMTKDLKRLKAKKNLTYREKIRISEILYQTQQPEESEKQLLQLLKESSSRPRQLEILLLLGRGTQNRDFNQSREWYRKALEVAEKNWEKSPLDRYRIASLYKTTGEPGKSMEYFKQLIKMEMSNRLKSGVHYHLADIYICSGQKKKALAHLMSCLDLNPGHKMATKRISEVQ